VVFGEEREGLSYRGWLLMRWWGGGEW
jgi:hypothetical protein